MPEWNLIQHWLGSEIQHKNFRGCNIEPKFGTYVDKRLRTVHLIPGLPVPTNDVPHQGSAQVSPVLHGSARHDVAQATPFPSDEVLPLLHGLRRPGWYPRGWCQEDSLGYYKESYARVDLVRSFISCLFIQFFTCDASLVTFDNFPNYGYYVSKIFF